MTRTVKYHLVFWLYVGMSLLVAYGVGASMLSRLLQVPATSVLPPASSMAKAWTSEQPKLTREQEDYLVWQRGYTQGIQAALHGWELSDGEIECINQLSPSQRNAHYEVRQRSKKAAVNEHGKSMKFEEGSCDAFLGEEKDCLGRAVALGIMWDMFATMDSRELFLSSFVVERTVGECGVKFWVRSMDEDTAYTFCSYVRAGYGYYKCKVHCAENQRE